MKAADNTRRRLSRAAVALSAVFLLLSAAAVCSCSRRVYVPLKEEYTRTLLQQRTDTIMRLIQRTDTVIDRDTVREIQRGDTLLREIVRWRIRYSQNRDTASRAHIEAVHDTVVRSVPCPVEVVKTVEVRRPLSWWQKTLMWSGGVLFIAIGAVAAWRIRRFM